MSPGSTVIPVVLSAALTTLFQQQAAQPDQHLILQRPGPSSASINEESVFVDQIGTVPRHLRVTLDPTSTVLGVGYLDFELIVPDADVELDGVALPQPRPFYLSRTEISVASASTLWRNAPGLTSPSIYTVPHEKTHLAAQFPDHLEEIREVRESPGMPFIADSTDVAAKVLDGLSTLSGLPARLPTLAEILLAMPKDEDVLLAAAECQHVPDKPWFLSLRSVADDCQGESTFTNIVGNVSEAARPTAVERRLLAERHFEIDAPGIIPYRSKNRAMILAEDIVSVGGNPGMSPVDVANALTVPGIILSRASGWDRARPTGIRPVLEIEQLQKAMPAKRLD